MLTRIALVVPVLVLLLLAACDPGEDQYVRPSCTGAVAPTEWLTGMLILRDGALEASIFTTEMLDGLNLGDAIDHVEFATATSVREADDGGPNHYLFVNLVPDEGTPVVRFNIYVKCEDAEPLPVVASGGVSELKEQNDLSLMTFQGP